MDRTARSSSSASTGISRAATPSSAAASSVTSRVMPPRMCVVSGCVRSSPSITAKMFDVEPSITTPSRMSTASSA
ncbi:MAG TPA: hypothetical protein VF488_07695, partial [Gemmatimonadaceae bacterium]